MKNNFPTFLVIGAQKGGTSWLYQQINRHPEIWMPPVKELHFFDQNLEKISQQNLSGLNLIKSRVLGSNPWEKDRTISTVKSIAKSISTGNFINIAWWVHWNFGAIDEEWYRRLFSPGSSYQVRGEITPAYSILDESKISLIKAINPDMKIIFILRNPADRDWSAAKYSYLRGKAKHDLESTEDIINSLNKRSFELRGNYERTINNYSKYFDSSQILICFYDAIKSDPTGLINGITDFLEVGRLSQSAINETKKVNASSNQKIPADLKQYLIEKYAPMNNRLAQKLGSYASFWDGVEASNLKRQKSALPPSIYLDQTNNQY